MRTTINYRGYTIMAYPDPNTGNPRHHDNATTMACFHNRYQLGDAVQYRHADYNSWGELETAILIREKPACILPLFMYDHSGITIATQPFADRWDSGQIGFVWITEKSAKKLGIKKDIPGRWHKLQATIALEVQAYDDYLGGDAVQVIAEDQQGDVVFSRGALYREAIQQSAIQSAKEAVDHDIETTKENRELEQRAV